LGEWKSGRGLLGPLKPLLGAWASPPGRQEAEMPMRCTRVFRSFGKGWIELDARWEMGGRGEYREIAMFGPMPDGTLGFRSFTNDGKRSEGRLADGTDIHPEAIAFEAEMPAGVARVIYWPLEGEAGFNFAVESRTKKGWNRFMRLEFRPEI
jgi:hypothetical protein